MCVRVFCVFRKKKYTSIKPSIITSSTTYHFSTTYIMAHPAGIRNIIARYEDLSVTSVTSNRKNQQLTAKLPNITGESRSSFSSALENQHHGVGGGLMMLKRSPAFHRRRKCHQQRQGKWRQSIQLWQEQAFKNQNLALTQRYLKHLG